MKAGNQSWHTPEKLRILAAFGINHICSGLPSRTFDDNWSVNSLSKLREQVEGFGIKLDMVPLPMSSLEISKMEMPAILLAKDPDRDREIDQICKIIENCAKAEIPAAKYNLTLPGRGPHGEHEGTRRRDVQHLRIRQGEAGHADGGGPRDGRDDVGAHHLLF